MKMILYSKIQKAQQAGYPCGNQLLYDIGDNGKAGSLDHTLGLCDCAPPAEGSQRQAKDKFFGLQKCTGAQISDSVGDLKGWKKQAV